MSPGAVRQVVIPLELRPRSCQSLTVAFVLQSVFDYRLYVGAEIDEAEALDQVSDFY
jgi:hypothetical protein